MSSRWVVATVAAGMVGGFAVVSTGQSAGLVPQGSAASDVVASARPVGVLECDGDSVGTMADYFGDEGLSVEDALSEAKSMVLREMEDSVSSSERFDLEGGSILFAFSDRSDRVIGRIQLAPVGDGWRFESGGRCALG